MHVLHFVSFLSATLPLAAQTIVSPQHFTATEANTVGVHGLGTTSTPIRYLAIHGELQGGPRTIQSFSFRRDGNVLNSGTIPGFSIVCDVFLSTAATTPGQPSATFDSNHGSNRRQVNSLSLVQFPETFPGAMPRPWAYTIPLNQPYAHDGSGPLCLDLRILSRTNVVQVALDTSSSSSPNPQPLVRQFGQGCRYTLSGERLTLSASASASWTQRNMTANLSGSNAKPSSLAYLSVGASSTSLGGIPLPFQVPGSANEPSGACHVYNDVLVALPAFANPSGSINAGFTIGVTPAFTGLSLFMQLISPDPAANSWGLVLSDSVEVHVVSPYTATPIGEVYNDTSTGPSGTVRANAGYVTKFN